MRNFLICCLFLFSFSPLQSRAVIAKDKPKDPFAKWEKSITSFERDDAQNPKEPGQVLFIGSSSIRMWDLKKWFPDLAAINRGFGGSEVADSVHFYDRIVKPYAPRTIVMYAGDNDLGHGKTPERVHSDFQQFVKKVQSDFPKTKIVYVAVKPSLKRWNLIKQVRQANQLIQAMAEEDTKLVFLDIDTPMIGEDGKPKPELFAKDGLHLSDAGYTIWSDLLRPNLKKEKPVDSRLQAWRDIYDAYHPWTPPNSLKEWKVEADRIRRQVLVSNGLWPLPARTPLSPVIHGKIDQGDYTIEKVYFSSRPGHYVTGSLYRPKNLKGEAPGVLCPHGHWQNGRFYDAGAGAKAQLESGAEQFESGAHSPIQARMVQLAKMGCVVFHYDMIGYADSQPLDHRTGFNDAEAAMQLHNIMGLQTWNSIRCLDFIESLPDVDPSRLAVTGASGGGTQTMILAAVDERVAAAFPAVMVSTGMQGGCVCENSSYMRQGVNNVAFAALFAPKPQAMSGADDWTIEIETKGLPELKQVYSLYNQAQNVHAAAFPQFKHNYNQVSRQVMYDWFNDHLALNIEGPVQQTDFQPHTPQELSVFDAEHPLPDDALAAKELRKLMVAEDQVEFKTWLQGSEKEYRSIVGGAAKVMLSPDVGEVEIVNHDQVAESSSLKAQSATVSYSDGAAVPVNVYQPANHSKGTVYLFTGEPIAAAPSQEVQTLVNSGLTVVTAELFLTGDAEEAAAYKVDKKYPGLSYCYNKPLVTERVRDIIAVVKAIPVEDGKRKILVGDGAAGVWTLLASSVLDSSVVDEVFVDLEGFTFAGIESVDDPNLLPGALKYGGLTGLSRLIHAKSLKVHGVKDPVQFENAFKGKNSPNQVTISATSLSSDEIVTEIVGAK